MKAVVFDRFGDPAEVLQVRDVPVPQPAAGQVRVRMLASPVNPSDLMVVRGLYGRLPNLPATPGFEGVGVVEAAGPGLLGWLRKGKRVAVLNAHGGTWQEQVLVPARQVVPIAVGVSDQQAAMFFVNPATALVMIRHVLRVPRGAWLLQTAAGSALGRMVIRLSKLDGFRTINVVRRREQGEELLRLGADAVICTADEAIDERVRALTDGKGVPCALDAVGGATGSAVVSALAPGGRLLVYGTLAGEPLTIPPRALMVADAHVEGFWLSNWARRQGVLPMLRLFRQINALLADGQFATEVGATFTLDEIQQAARAAETPGRTGKVLLRFA
ncbi:MAG: zinc-dependent alcohol dehydrogenase family protein [Planctomycetia bacterium]|nr:zinc-dependent alcohol dehydrogenase family protein [Planctomycetia bacterium]